MPIHCVLDFTRHVFCPRYFGLFTVDAYSDSPALAVNNKFIASPLFRRVGVVPRVKEVSNKVYSAGLGGVVRRGSGDRVRRGERC